MRAMRGRCGQLTGFPLRRERGGEEVSKGEVPPGIPQGDLSPFFFTVDVFFELKVICDQVCLGFKELQRCENTDIRLA